MFSNRKFSSVHSELNIPVPDFIPFIKREDNDDGPAAKRSKTLDVDISGTKVMGLSTGTVPCNEPLCEMIKVVKPIIRELVEDCKYSTCILIQIIFWSNESQIVICCEISVNVKFFYGKARFLCVWWTISYNYIFLVSLEMVMDKIIDWAFCCFYRCCHCYPELTGLRLLR